MQLQFEFTLLSGFSAGIVMMLRDIVSEIYPQIEHSLLGTSCCHATTNLLAESASKLRVSAYQLDKKSVTKFMFFKCVIKSVGLSIKNQGITIHLMVACGGHDYAVYSMTAGLLFL